MVSSIRLIKVVGVGALVIAVGYGGLAVAPSLAIACVASAVGGAGNGAGWVAAVTSIQERIPMNAQSAVMTLLEGLNQVMPAIGFVVGGVLTAATSPRLAYGAAAVGVALVLLVTAARPIDRVTFRAGPPRGGRTPEPEPLAEPEPQESTNARTSKLSVPDLQGFSPMTEIDTQNEFDHADRTRSDSDPESHPISSGGELHRSGGCAARGHSALPH